MDPNFLSWLWPLPLGLLVGTVGTLIGAGGGFILVPVLLLIFPGAPAETITGISLTVVFFNAVSGSAAYSRMKRIDYKSGLLFAAAALPGALIGAWATKFIPRLLFNGIFGAVLVLLAVYLALRTKKEAPHTEDPPVKGGKYRFTQIVRTLVDWESITYVFAYNPVLGVTVSVFVGFLSSLLGIGGGIFHVPLLAMALNFPVHIATATSHFVLAIMSAAGTVVHLVNGDLSQSAVVVGGLALGVIVGAQVGARLSNRVQGVWIIRGLALTLVLVGARLVATGLGA